MAQQTRQLNSIGLAREDDAAKGTAVALSTGHTITVESGKLHQDTTYAMIEGAHGNAMQGIEQHIVQKLCSLNFTAAVKSDWLGHILTGLLGTVSSANSGGETLVRDHTITVLNTSGDMPAYTVFNLDAIQNDRATYATFKKLVLRCTPNSLLMSDVEMLAQKIEDGSGTAAHATDHHFQGSHCTIKIASDASGLGAAAGVAFSSLELTIEREIFPVYGFVTSTHTDPAEPIRFTGGKLMVSGKLTIPWENQTYRDYVLQATDNALRIDFEDTGTTIGSAESPSVTIDLAKVNWLNAERPDGINEVDEETLEFQGVYDIDDGTLNDCKALLVNEEAATAYTEPA